ncbi:MAG: 50S ribosomal protein L23 [Candidatus Paceibacterota bacterium]
MSRLGNKLNIGKIILRQPRITEKATLLSSREKPVYTFTVPPEANKTMIKQAVIERFKVTPVKISIVNLPPKRKTVRRVPGVRSGIKKALVYLTPGQTIDAL